MKQAKFLGLKLAAVALTIRLAACGGNSEKNANIRGDPQHSVIMVTDTADIDDKSFNQSAWEGMQEWGKEHKPPGGPQGYACVQLNGASDYTSDIDQATLSQFKTIFGIGCLLKNAVVGAADINPEASFVLINDIVSERGSAASATFKGNESAHLANVATANTTKTDKVGFIDGVEGPVIGRFQAGFEKGIADTGKKLGKDIQITSTYAGTFADASRERALASSMYQADADVIYHAAAAIGQGVFQEVKALSKAGSKGKVWMIGVDHDQNEDDKYTTKDGKDDNLALASTTKGVNITVEKIPDLALEDKFPSGEHLTYGLKGDGVDLATEALSDQAKTAVREAKEQIISGGVKVPDQP